MKRSIRLYLTGSVQSLFFEQFIKTHADNLNVYGFLRRLEDGRVEIFLEGDNSNVEEMASICRRGPKYAKIRNIDEKEEKFQEFKEFKILKI
ncbi:MAG: acylphosphatase [Nanoarchaeota archaeon]